MRNSKKSGEKSIETAGELRTRKVKLERVNQIATKHKKAEETLRGPEDLYQAVMENTFFGFTLIDHDYKICMVNSMISKYFHKPAEELIGKECFREFEKHKAVCPHCPGTRAMATSQPAEIETEKVLDDGSHFSACIQAFPVIQQDGAITGFIEIVEDISQRKQAEQEIRNLAKFPSENPYPVMRISSDGKILYANAPSMELLREKNNAIGQPAPDELCKAAKQALNSASVVRIEVEHQGKTYAFRAMPVVDVGYCNFYGLDITERKKAEEALRESETHYRELFDGVADAVMVYSSQGRFMDCNEVTLKRLGYSYEEILNLSAADIVHPDFHAVMRDNQKKIWAGEITIVESAHRCKDGRVIPVEVNARRIEYAGEPAILAVVRDIHDRKKAKEVLRETTQMLQAVIQASPLPIFVVDRERIVKTWNPAAERAFGWSAQEVIGRKYPAIPEEKMDEADALFSRALESGLTEVETIRQRKDGSLIDVSISAAPLRDSHGNINGVMAVITDITERKRAENELRKFKTISDKAGYGITIVDLEGNVSYVNTSFAKMHGYTPDELIGKHLSIFHTEQQTANVNRLIEQLNREGNYVAEEVWHKRKDNTEFPTLMNGTLVKDENGTPLFMAATAVDITERKKAEEKLKQYQFIVESAHDAIFFKDLESRYIIANDRALEALGLPRQQVIGKDDYEILANEAEAKKNIEDDKIVFKTSKPIEITKLMTGADGKQRWFQAIKVPKFDDKGKIVGLVGIARDITERKKAEEALRDSETLYASLVENLQQYIFRKDLEGRFTFGNKRFCETLDRPLDEIIGKTDFDFYPAQLAEKYRRDDQNVIETQEVFDTVEEHKLSNGKKIYVQVVKTPLYDSAGEVIGTQGIFWDITERKKAEQTLKRERDKAQTYLDVAAVMIVAIDSEGRVGLINKKGCQILGYSEDEILAKNWFDNFLPKNIKDEVKEIFDKILSGQADEPEYYENPVLTKDGGERLIAWHNTILRDDKGNIIAALSSGADITERGKAEQKLREDQEQLRYLASQLTLAEEHERRRIAAELHASISQNLVISKLKLDELRASAPLRDFAEILSEVCGLLGRTIEETRTLTYDLGAPLLDELGFVDAVAEWLNTRIQEKYRIKTEFEVNGQPKNIDKDIEAVLFSSMRELLMNVVKHAQAKKVRVSICKVADQIQVSVEDDGWGFDPVEAAKKAVKTGAFGLFSIRQRLEQLGGHLEIKSAPGCGCKVTMTAPLKQDVARKAGDDQEA